MLSVVIPALNSSSTITYTLSSIFSNDFPRKLLEVIVVDNGSTDGTIEVAKKFPVEIYKCPIRGIGPPRNFGREKAKGDILCYTDSDCIVDRSWLRTIHDFFEANTDIDGIGGPTLPYPYAQNKIQELTGEIFVDEQIYPTTQKNVKYGSSGPLLFGSNSAYRKEALKAVGGFPEPGGSSLELSWKLTAITRKLIFIPEIKVFHIFPSDLRTILKQYYRWGSQLASMQRRYRGKAEAMKGLVFSFYGLIMQLLSLVSLSTDAKKLLRLSQAFAFSIGRLRGFSGALI